MQARRSVVVGVAGVVAGLALVAGIALLARSGDIEARLGDDVFVAGQVERLSAAVRRDGPIAFPDASPRRQRDLYVQHLGPGPEDGWLAFSAQAPGAERRCLLQWLPVEEEFVDPCSGRRYPPDGEGLTQYPTVVEDGQLSVDLRQPRAS
ncbi:MAG: hypothetical protein M3N15_07270 [Actinomycetota bacterium]|nr:hypothetical protein [Actinomycetota bacterium]